MQRWMMAAVNWVHACIRGAGMRRYWWLVAAVAVAGLATRVPESIAGIGGAARLLGTGGEAAMANPSNPAPVGQTRSLQTMGYVPENDGEAAWASAAAHRELLSGVTLVQYYLDGNGNLLPLHGAG